MKKIDALAIIIKEDSKIAYNTRIKHAMCAVGGFVNYYRVQDDILTKELTNEEVNCNLLEEEWEIFDKYIGMLKDFKFPPEYREITRDEAYAMLDKPEEERKVQVKYKNTCYWVDAILTGVGTGENPFISCSSVRYRCCRVKV